jgi:hypothetical protein
MIGYPFSLGKQGGRSKSQQQVAIMLAAHLGVDGLELGDAVAERSNLSGAHKGEVLRMHEGSKASMTQLAHALPSNAHVG